MSKGFEVDLEASRERRDEGLARFVERTAPDADTPSRCFFVTYQWIDRDMIAANSPEEAKAEFIERYGIDEEWHAFIEVEENV